MVPSGSWAFAYCPMLTSHLSLVDHFELLDRMQTNILLERERCDIELRWVSIQNADLIHLHHSTHPCPHPPSTFRPLHLETLLRHARLVTCWYNVCSCSVDIPRRHDHHGTLSGDSMLSTRYPSLNVFVYDPWNTHHTVWRCRYPDIYIKDTNTHNVDRPTNYSYYSYSMSV